MSMPRGDLGRIVDQGSYSSEGRAIHLAPERMKVTPLLRGGCLFKYTAIRRLSEGLVPKQSSVLRVTS